MAGPVPDEAPPGPDRDRLAEIAGAVVDRAAGSGGATVLVERLRHGLTRFANSTVHQHVTEDTTTVTLRMTVEGRSATASTTRVAGDALDRLVDDTAELAALRPPDEHAPGPAPPAEPVADDRHDPDTAGADPAARVAGVAGFVGADPELSAAGYLDTGSRELAAATTAGQQLVTGATRATVDGIHRSGAAAGSGHQTDRRLAALDGSAAGARAARLARRGEGAEDLGPGTYPVVLGPDAVGTIAAFLGMYGFNAKSHLEGESFVRLGEQQFDPAVSLADDVTDPRSVGLPVDAEATPRRPVTLVDDGTTAGLVHDRRTALRADTESTGHAIPGGESIGPVPTDLVLAGGDAPHDELVAGLERGLLVTDLHYCRVLDPKTMVVTGLTRNGTFLVEDGMVRRPVTDLRFTQSFVEALSPGRVAAVGDDDRYAASEIHAGAVIAPSLHLTEWRFTGGASG